VKKKNVSFKKLYKFQSMVEYAALMTFISFTTYILYDLFLFGFQSDDADKHANTFSGALLQLHDTIVSVISAPVP